VPAHICVVEDDPTIRELVSRKLRSQGYSVDAFDSAETVMTDVKASERWELFILDVLLAGRATGLDLCGSLRKRSPNLPILILSALGEPSDRVEGLKVGADDYLTKPFDMEELLLRVQGMLRRRSWYGSLPKNASVYKWNDCSIDFLSLEGMKGRHRFSLSTKECMLMKLLIEREGVVVGRDEILDKVWGYDVFPSTRTVDNFVVRLRKLFEDSPSDPKCIQSVRGIGYKFCR
jgi:two-component system, OmpR family, alkaline phosphatase synthesis response regulator PhoP